MVILHPDLPIKANVDKYKELSFPRDRKAGQLTSADMIFLNGFL